MTRDTPQRNARRSDAPTPKSGSSGALLGVAGLVAAAAAIGGLYAWTKRSSGNPASLLVGADVSMSQTVPDRKSYCNVLDAAMEEAMPPGSKLTLWAFDKRAGKMYEGNPRTPTELAGVEDQVIDYKSTSQGTTPACVLPDMVQAAKESDSRGEPTAAMLLWDAEDMSPAKTKDLAQQLADIPSFKTLWIVGVPTDDKGIARKLVEKEFAPLGGKLIVANRFDMGDGLEQFRSSVRPR